MPAHTDLAPSEVRIAAGKSPDEIEREVAELGRAIRATLAPSGAA